MAEVKPMTAALVAAAPRVGGLLEPRGPAPTRLQRLAAEDDGDHPKGRAVAETVVMNSDRNMSKKPPNECACTK